ncbi:VOC family protein [Rhodoferax sp.]|uniref:VOC family protein n=1 Tax=Rhodoferax sp. TaxID=50421 RepID=UPI00374DBC81
MSAEFVWYELLTTDASAAEAFYRAVVGWDIQDAGMPDRRYAILSKGPAPVGGLMALPQESLDAGLRPRWLGYVGVDDVNDYAARVLQAGGSIHRAPEDIPNIGRFAVVADPQGAPFVLFKGLPMERPPQPAMGTPGFIGWHELHATDWQAAYPFYAGLFGWTKGEAIDMGPMGVYQLFSNGGPAIGGMMTRADKVTVASWLYYINVEQIDAAVDRVKAHGGKVLNGPHEVPGGSWIANCIDPQEALFALVGPR